MDSQPAPEVPASPASAPDGHTPFPIVGIGASAGGFQALSTLLENMPPEPGMALVVILHLAADEPSTADRVLQRATDMPVVQVSHATRILPDKVYVIPPDRSLKMHDGHLVLGELDRSARRPVAIDTFMCALAEAHGPDAIGVVLSGMGSDGTAGLACIKEMGGITIAQLPDEADQGSMPRAAIDAGMADFVLAADQIPAKLTALRDMARLIRFQAAQPGQPHAEAEGEHDMAAHPPAALRELLALLRTRTGHDFTHYRRPTLIRRVKRRMQVCGVADIGAYYQLLRHDGDEPQALLKDLLIGVTKFFRDRAAFDALDRDVLPALFASLPEGQPLRAWVAACSTGEEAYTLAMLLADMAASAGARRKLQLFASDIDEHAIDVARTGVYPASIAEQVPPPQLERWFTREGGRFRVRKALRDQVLFTRHNLLQDPAFTRLDLISCRNLLIYLNPHTHRYLLQQFHFALNPGGFLMLGGAESADVAGDLFVAVDAANRIYRARPVARAAGPMPELPGSAGAGPGQAAVQASTAGAGPGSSDPTAKQRGRLFSFAEIHLHKSAELAPPSVLLDANGDIVHVSERAARFLQTSGGEPTRELVALVQRELQLPLRAALFHTRKGWSPARSGPVRFERDDGAHLVDIALLPFQDEHAEGRLILVQFLELQDMAPLPVASLSHDESALAQQLDEELGQTRRQLQDTVEQAERAGNDMLVYTEEMQTTIEQLRVHAEELERGRDLLRSNNLELEADSRELRRSAEDSAKAHDDLENLIASSGVATIFLDRDMRIVRFTPRIADFFNVIPADIGRPLTHITNRLNYPELANDAAHVFESLQAMEHEVHDQQGHDFIVRVHPYRTQEDRIEGAVMTFFDITSHRATEAAKRDIEQRFGVFVTAVSDSLYKMSADWSEMRYLQGMEFLADTRDPSRTWLEKYIAPEDQPRVSAAIAEAIASKSNFALEHRVIGADGELVWVFSRAAPALDRDGNVVEWFGTAANVTQRKQVQEAQRLSEARLAAVFESLPVAVGVFDGSGRMSLSNAAMKRYVPNGIMPSADPARISRWRALDADGKPVMPDNYPGLRALRGERVVPGIEMLFTADDGRETWTQVAASPVTNEEGEVIGQVAVISDIDRLKRSQAALHENERRLRELMGEFALTVWETDANGMVVTDSPSWRACTGQTLDEWMGKGWLDAIHPDDRDGAAAQWEAAVRKNGSVDTQFRLRSAQGGWRLTHVRAAPLVGADGAIEKWVGMNVEVGER